MTTRRTVAAVGPITTARTLRTRPCLRRITLRRLYAGAVRALAGACLALGLGGCAHPPDGHYTTSRTRPALGTTATITAVGPNEDRTERAVDAAFAEIARLEAVLSTYDPATPLARLNRDGRLDDADPEVLTVLERARYYSELSGGAFDITMLPLLDLYQETFIGADRPPSDDELERARALVGFEQVHLDGEDVTLGRPGMRISVDGIAKGFIIDRAAQALVAAGVEDALVDIGGDIRALGRPAARPFWVVGIRHPRRPPTDFLVTIRAADSATATSGDYEHYFVEDRRAHHLIDPRTGRSATELSGVTVVADSAMDADALATTVFILGPSAGVALLESIDGAEGLMITTDGELVATVGWERLVAR